MEHKTDTEKGCTSLLLFVLMPEAGLGEEAREGKEGKGAGRRGAIDFQIAGRSLNHYLFHLSHMCLYTVGSVTHSCKSITDMTKSTHPCGCHGNFVFIDNNQVLKFCRQKKTLVQSLHSCSSTDTVHLPIGSNVTIVISYLFFPVTGHTTGLLGFLMLAGEEGLNLIWESILRKTLLEHLPALTGSRQDDSFHAHPPELPLDKPLSLFLCARAI